MPETGSACSCAGIRDGPARDATGRREAPSLHWVARQSGYLFRASRVAPLLGVALLRNGSAAAASNGTERLRHRTVLRRGVGAHCPVPPVSASRLAPIQGFAVRLPGATAAAIATLAATTSPTAATPPSVATPALALAAAAFAATSFHITCELATAGEREYVAQDGKAHVSAAEKQASTCTKEGRVVCITKKDGAFVVWVWVLRALAN